MASVFVLAVLIGGVAALLGSRTAVALLAGTFAQMLLPPCGVPFNAALWMAVDAMVIAAIIRPGWSRADALVVALFVPAWGFYFVDGWPGYDGSVVACSAQFLLAFPWAAAWRRVRKINRGFNPWEKFDLRTQHGVA